MKRSSLLLQVDSSNYVIRRINISSGVVSTFVGNVALGLVQADGQGGSATMCFGDAVAIDAGAVALFVRISLSLALSSTFRASIYHISSSLIFVLH